MVRRFRFRFEIFPYFLAACTALAAATTAPAQILQQLGKWRTFTDTRNAISLISVDDRVWAATSGGVLAYDTADSSFQTFTNAEGLHSNNVTAIAFDRNGKIWAALSNGFINLIEPESGAIELIVDYERALIQDIFAYGDTIYLALDFGIAEYRLAKEEPKELYRKLGDVQAEIPVQRILVHNNMLYAATDEGIAIADLDFPNLKAPQSWQNITVADGLPGNNVRDLAVYDGRVVAATGSGIAIEESGSWRDLSGSLPNRDVRAMAVRESFASMELFITTPAGVYVTQDLVLWTKLPPLPDIVQALVVHEGAIFVAVAGSGLARYNDAANRWEMLEPNSPRGNILSSIFFDQRSKILWCTSTQAGAFAFDGTKWYDLPELSTIGTSDYRTVAVDSSGRVWLGTWGRGLIQLTGSLDSLQVVKIDTTGGFLAGATPVNAAFVVVRDVTLDRNGNVWLVNFGALNGRALAAVTPDNRWAYFSTTFGLKTTEITTVLVDQLNRVWYGTEGEGVEVIDFQQTLFDPTGDNLALGLVPVDRLNSPHITSLAEDRDGTIWIGTRDGLYYYFNDGVFQFFGAGGERLINEDIRVVKVDPANNKWIGTIGGVSILGADSFTLESLTAETTPLVSNSVTDFAFDEERGTAYIATTNGLSVVETPFTAPKQDFSQLTGYPNPLVLDGDAVSFVIKNLAGQSSVRIFTEDGRLVREYGTGAIPGSQLVWNGRDADGQLVPSGVYYFVASTSDGKRAVGKVAVVRK